MELEFHAKFAATEHQESIMESQVATDAVDFLSEAFEGNFLKLISFNYA